jgi:hypothetical protein
LTGILSGLGHGYMAKQEIVSRKSRGYVVVDKQSIRRLTCNDGASNTRSIFGVVGDDVPAMTRLVSALPQKQNIIAHLSIRTFPSRQRCRPKPREFGRRIQGISTRTQN